LIKRWFCKPGQDDCRWLPDFSVVFRIMCAVIQAVIEARCGCGKHGRIGGECAEAGTCQANVQPLCRFICEQAIDPPSAYAGNTRARSDYLPLRTTGQYAGTPNAFPRTWLPYSCSVPLK